MFKKSYSNSVNLIKLVFAVLHDNQGDHHAKVEGFILSIWSLFRVINNNQGDHHAKVMAFYSVNLITLLRHEPQSRKSFCKGCGLHSVNLVTLLSHELQSRWSPFKCCGFFYRYMTHLKIRNKNIQEQAIFTDSEENGFKVILHTYLVLISCIIYLLSLWLFRNRSRKPSVS